MRAEDVARPKCNTTTSRRLTMWQSIRDWFECKSTKWCKTWGFSRLSAPILTRFILYRATTQSTGGFVIMTASNSQPVYGHNSWTIKPPPLKTTASDVILLQYFLRSGDGSLLYLRRCWLIVSFFVALYPLLPSFIHPGSRWSPLQMRSFGFFPVEV